MALTTTYTTGAVTSGATLITLNAYTAPSRAAIASKPLLRVDAEYMLIVDESLAPTLQVVRGYWGSTAAAHKIDAPVVYGLPGDSSWSNAVPRSLNQPVEAWNALDVVATGTTGTSAAPVTIPAPGLINCNATGVSGAGINLPYATVGATYVITNGQTGVVKIYAIGVGSTINGTTGTTAFSLTATGNLTATALCTVAGAWHIVGNT